MNNENELKVAPKEFTECGKTKDEIHLIPMDVLVKYVLPAYLEGIEKYGEGTWRRGFKASHMIDAALRHILKWYWGCEDEDGEGGKNHLAGAIFSLLAAIWSVYELVGFDDRELFK